MGSGNRGSSLAADIPTRTICTGKGQVLSMPIYGMERVQVRDKYSACPYMAWNSMPRTYGMERVHASNK